MLRSLSSWDLPLILVEGWWKYSNEARPRDGLAGREALLRWLGVLAADRFALEKGRRIWTMRRGLRVLAIASARPRSGSRVWEVDQLRWAVTDSVIQVDVLEGLISATAKMRAEKLFLRLPRGNVSVDAARKAGFRACMEEVLYEREARPRNGRINLPEGVRPRKAQDDHALFRLYNYAMPTACRTSLGLTFDAWKEAQESSGRLKEDLVMEKEGSLMVWLRAWECGKSGVLDLLIHPEQEKVEPLITLGSSSLGRSERILCLVPQFQKVLRYHLELLGFQVVGEYHNLVKQMTAEIKHSALAAVKAISG